MTALLFVVMLGGSVVNLWTAHQLREVSRSHEVLAASLLQIVKAADEVKRDADRSLSRFLSHLHQELRMIAVALERRR